MIERQGWQQGRVYQDIESGYTVNRAQYQQMLQDAEAGKFQVLVIWKLDRLTRNTREGLRAVHHLVERLGVKIISATELLDFETARGKRNVRDDLSAAEFERDRIIERVMPGMKRGVQKGHWQGARYCFYGYRYDKPNQKLVELPEEIRTLCLVFQHRASGLASYSIALRLAEVGIRNRAGRLFTTHQLEVMLRRRFYVDGHLEWNGVRSEQPVVAPVIDRETWEKVQAVYQERSRTPKTPSPGRVTSPYVLQGALKCRFCGGNMVGQRSTANHRTGEKAPWYTCGQRLQRTRKACRGQYVKAETAHRLAFEILKRVMQNPQLIELTRRQLRAALEQGHPQLAKRVRELRETIHRLKQAQTKWRDAYYQEAMTTQQFKEENLRLVRELELAEHDLSLAETKLHGADRFRGKLDQVFALLQEFEAVWAKMTPVQQRVVYRGVFHYVRIEGVKWSRRFTVEDFSLKEPFQSWYDGRAWNGPLLLTEEGSVVVTNQQDKELCESSTFAPTAVR